MQDRQRQTIPDSPRSVHDPYGTTCWVSILLSTKLVKDVKQTLGIPSLTRLTALKIAVIHAEKPRYPCCMSNESTWFKGKCSLFYYCFGNCRRLAYKISAYEVCIICSKLIAACKIHCKSPSRRPDSPTMLDWFTVHKATLSAYIRESAYVRSHVGCGRVHQTLLLYVPQIFQRRKSDGNKQDFNIEVKFDLSSPINPQNNRDLNQGTLHLWPSDGQAQNGVNFDSN